ncbi:MAG: hypothetical protein H5U36_07955, partial [Candidatus Caldatribacterium sp.]|nr:hypothetical protein [Candidatus Caldatribacterium sp.]
MRKGKVWIDATRRKGRLSPFVYGSFIEHLGRCVYGGIWAEKIRNGKFAGEDPNHCGVIYPWLPFGEQKGRNVYFTHDNTCFYVGSQSQRVEIMAPGTMAGIFQDIIVDDCAFKVRCVLRGEGIGNPVWVRLQRGEEVFVETGLEVGPDWKVFDFEWKVTPVLFRKEVSFVIAFEGPGTLWVGYVSMMPINRSWKGMRKDVLSAIRMLRPTILRWPGGNFASNYHWMDGVGPRDKRPPRWDRAWSTWEPNDFGTDEFMELCRFVGAEPYICVNIGTGTPEEAAAWVEYCNGDPSSRYGSLRAENGHPEPYSVRFWGIGNETYGNWQIGHVDPETYGKKCLEFVRTMKAVDPNIVLVAVGVNEVG